MNSPFDWHCMACGTMNGDRQPCVTCEQAEAADDEWLAESRDDAVFLRDAKVVELIDEAIGSDCRSSRSAAYEAIQCMMQSWIREGRPEPDIADFDPADWRPE